MWLQNKRLGDGSVFLVLTKYFLAESRSFQFTYIPTAKILLSCVLCQSGHLTLTWCVLAFAIVPAAAAAAAKSLQSCPTLCDPIDSSPPGPTIPGILQARTLEWVAISFSNCMKVKSESEVTQLCLTVCDPMNCSLPGSSVHGIFQARVVEWVAIAFSGNCSYLLANESFIQYYLRFKFVQ